MLRKFLLIIVATTLVGAETGDTDCPRTVISTLYSELGCVPIRENNSTCPTSYDCSKHESRDQTKCNYAGKAYNIDEEVSFISFGYANGSCKCRAGDADDPNPYFSCWRLQCPTTGPEDSECRYVVEPGTDCLKKSCGSNINASSITCTYQDKTFIENERFYGTCQVCQCKDNFKGRLEEPFCRDLKCDYELSFDININKGCVPVYLERDGCCPVDWRCPSDSDRISPKENKKRKRTNETCQFGSLVLQYGQQIEKKESNDTSLCICDLPPYVTCLVNRSD